ncbi:putative uncharacterized protein [Prevotella sp. CAG:1124]|nr:putative uncharacterized protein [Prevotella sp. CAG:1124]
MKSFFYLQRADRYALIALLAVVVAAVGLLLYLGKPGETASAVAVDSTAVDSAGVGPGRVRPNAVRYYAVEGRRAELFAFDPNTADSTELLRLGLAPWQVRNIYKYRASGGIYRKPSDFARLYGLTVGQYKALEPYIRISPDYRPAAGLAVAETHDMYVRDTLRYPLKLKPGEHVSLNAADTSLLKRVPGIGSGFARAIVGYRERLGGYYSVSQLLEISGFPQSALPYFDIGTARCRRLNVNTATLSQLRRHPYIGFYRAKTIVDHRRLHGIIRSLSELGLYKDFTPEAVDRLSHYVEF